ncbi:MAG TPA: sulfite exporter TauE/SafE family protein [Acidimicrobiales bacterium]|nr:sulfite exporter TauE/SafE family protein [Acidimicrobiales bacterium]
MMIATLALGWRLTIFAAAGVAGGIANGVAGGGTFITFPTLLALGIPALQANVSTTVGVVPSYLAGLSTYRRTASVDRGRLRALVVPSLLGTLVGCALLLTGSAQTFRAVVPWLIGAATLLFAAAPVIARGLPHLEPDHPARRRALSVGVFFAAIYGGYFGAGLGIMLLAVMAVTLPEDIHQLQGLRATLSTLICAGAALVFVLRGHLAVSAVAMLLVGSLVGGWLGTKLITRLSPLAVRVLVVAVGLATTVRLAVGG